MNKLLVNTPQNVQIEYDISVVGPRVLAFFIDTIIRIIYIWVVIKILEGVNYTDRWLEIGTYSLFLLPSFMYNVILETLMNGQTVGKWITRIRVVQVDGQKASFYNYFTRWLIGVFEINITFGILAFFTMLINRNHQRLGDIAANTVLISLKPKQNINHTIFNEIKDDYILTFPEVYRLSDRDINIINDNYNRAIQTNNLDILKLLTAKVEEIMQVESKGMEYRKFLQLVIQDHYHFHRNK